MGARSCRAQELNSLQMEFGLWLLVGEKKKVEDEKKGTRKGKRSTDFQSFSPPHISVQYGEKIATTQAAINYAMAYIYNNTNSEWIL